MIKESKNRHLFIAFLMIHVVLLYVIIVQVFIIKSLSWTDIINLVPLFAWAALGINFGLYFRHGIYDRMHPLSTFLFAPLLIVWPLLYFINVAPKNEK